MGDASVKDHVIFLFCYTFVEHRCCWLCIKSQCCESKHLELRSTEVKQSCQSLGSHMVEQSEFILHWHAREYAYGSRLFPLTQLESHAEWLLCTDIQRSQRGRTPFGWPSIARCTLWPMVVPFLCVKQAMLYAKCWWGDFYSVHTVTRRLPVHAMSLNVHQQRLYSVCLEPVRIIWAITNYLSASCETQIRSLVTLFQKQTGLHMCLSYSESMFWK